MNSHKQILQCNSNITSATGERPIHAKIYIIFDMFYLHYIYKKTLRTIL